MTDQIDISGGDALVVMANRIVNQQKRIDELVAFVKWVKYFPAMKVALMSGEEIQIFDPHIKAEATRLLEQEQKK